MEIRKSCWKVFLKYYFFFLILYSTITSCKKHHENVKRNLPERTYYPYVSYFLVKDQKNNTTLVHLGFNPYMNNLETFEVKNILIEGYKVINLGKDDLGNHRFLIKPKLHDEEIFIQIIIPQYMGEKTAVHGKFDENVEINKYYYKHSNEIHVFKLDGPRKDRYANVSMGQHSPSPLKELADKNGKIVLVQDPILSYNQFTFFREYVYVLGFIWEEINPDLIILVVGINGKKEIHDLSLGINLDMKNNELTSQSLENIIKTEYPVDYQAWSTQTFTIPYSQFILLLNERIIRMCVKFNDTESCTVIDNSGSQLNMTVKSFIKKIDTIRN